MTVVSLSNVMSPWWPLFVSKGGDAKTILDQIRRWSVITASVTLMSWPVLLFPHLCHPSLVSQYGRRGGTEQNIFLTLEQMEHRREYHHFSSPFLSLAPHLQLFHVSSFWFLPLISSLFCSRIRFPVANEMYTHSVWLWLYCSLKSTLMKLLFEGSCRNIFFPKNILSEKYSFAETNLKCSLSLLFCILSHFLPILTFRTIQNIYFLWMCVPFSDITITFWLLFTFIFYSRRTNCNFARFLFRTFNSFTFPLSPLSCQEGIIQDKRQQLPLNYTLKEEKRERERREASCEWSQGCHKFERTGQRFFSQIGRTVTEKE